MNTTATLLLERSIGCLLGFAYALVALALGALFFSRRDLK